MADEVGSAALSTGQKVIEVSVELIKMLAPLIEKLLQEVFLSSKIVTISPKMIKPYVSAKG